MTRTAKTTPLISAKNEISLIKNMFHFLNAEETDLDIMAVFVDHTLSDPAGDESRTLVQYLKACLNHLRNNYSQALFSLRDLCEAHPHVSQFQASISLLYCHLGMMEDALFAHKLSVSGESWEGLDWYPDYFEPFQNEFKAINSDPLYHRAKIGFSTGLTKDSFHLMREACLCQPDRLDFWSELALMSDKYELWFDCYQALRPLIAKSKLSPETYDCLLRALHGMGREAMIEEVFTSESSDLNAYYLADSVQITPKKAKTNLDTYLQQHSFWRKRNEIKTRQASKQEPRLHLAVSSGFLRHDRPPHPILNLLAQLQGSNVTASLLHRSDYVAPMISNLFHRFYSTRNINHLDDQTLQVILERERYSLLIDDGSIHSDKRVLFADKNTPCLTLFRTPEDATYLGYHASLIDPLVLDDAERSRYNEDPRTIVPDKSFLLKPTPKVTLDQIKGSSKNLAHRSILLPLPPQINDTTRERITRLCEALVGDWHLAISSKFYGGEATVKSTIDRLALHPSHRERLIIDSDFSSHPMERQVQAAVDLYGTGTLPALTYALSHCVPLFILKRHPIAERTSICLARQNNFENLIFNQENDLFEALNEFCLNDKNRTKMRMKLRDHLITAPDGLKQLETFVKTLYTFTKL